MADDQNKSGAQKRQVKFSGLIKGGVISPHVQPEQQQRYTSEVLTDQNEELPPESGNDSRIDKATPHQIQTEKVEKKKILLSLIDDSPYQPRLQYDPIDIDNLAHMLAAAGLDDVITVRRKQDNRYELIKGHRRTRAARSLGWEEIDAEIVIKDDRSAKLSAMISNEGQVGLTDYEKGKLYKEAKDDGYAKTQEQLALLFGTSQGHVSLRMGILDLPAVFIDMLERNPKMFGATTAIDIKKLIKEFPGQEELIEKAVLRINDGALESKVKDWVHQMLKPKAKRDEAVITDKAGRQIFKAKFSGREFTIQIKDAQVDAKEIEELVLAALRHRAENNPGDIQNA